jgi:thiol-disulfide isomerase/thioredoxin
MIRALLLFCLLTTPVMAETNPSWVDLEGKTHKLSDYQGRWVLVNYWATWCPPCMEELPELEILHSQHSDKIVVLGVNFEDATPERLRKFTDDLFLSYPILPVGLNPMPHELVGEIPGLPSSFLVNPKGEVEVRHVGSLTADMVLDFIAAQAQ